MRLTRRQMIFATGALLASACSTPAAQPSAAPGKTAVASPAASASSPAPQSGNTPTAAATAAPSIADVPVARIAWSDVGYPTPFRISTSGPGGAVLLSLVYDTLTWKDARGIIPWLAKSWEVSSDGLTYTFQLVSNARWHDGRPVTAEDVAFSYEYYQRFPYRWMTSTNVAGAEVVGPETVRIRMSRPYAPFLEDVAGILPIIPKHVWESVSDPVTFDAPESWIGSGPYRMAEYQPADGAYRLTAHDNYFAGRVFVRELQQINVPAETRMAALQQGQLDLSNTDDFSVTETVRNDPRIRVATSQPFSIVRMVANTKQPPLDRREVRQAIMYAIDRTRVAELVTKGPPIAGNPGVIPPGSPWHNPNVPAYPYDPERARSLLGGAEVEIELLSDTGYREAELIEPMLTEAGFKLKVNRADSKTRAQLLREGGFQLGIVKHIGVGGDPDFLRRWYSGEEANDYAQGSIFDHAEFTRLADEQAVTLDPERRKSIVFRMQEILAEELPTMVLYHRPFYWLHDPNKIRPVDTWGGLLNGIPFVHNKIGFLER